MVQGGHASSKKVLLMQTGEFTLREAGSACVGEWSTSVLVFKDPQAIGA